MVAPVKKDPAFLFYVTAWLQSRRVRAMSLEQRGAYVDLLCFAWLDSSIPADAEELRATLNVSRARFDAIWQRVGQHWTPDPSDSTRLVNDRQEVERVIRREKAEELRRRGQAGGKRSAEQRASTGQAGAQADGQADVQAEPKPSTSTSTSPSERVRAHPRADLPGFAEFWSVFKKKVKRPSAEKAWRKIDPDAALATIIIAKAEAYAATKPDKQYQANAATWLNERGWEDELIAPSSGGRVIAKPVIAMSAVHVFNTPLGSLSCQCAECVAYRAKRGAQ